MSLALRQVLPLLSPTECSSAFAVQVLPFQGSLGPTLVALSQ